MCIKRGLKKNACTSTLTDLRTMHNLAAGKRKSDLGFTDNKDIKIQSILGIRIHDFRSLKEQSLRRCEVGGLARRDCFK